MAKFLPPWPDSQKPLISVWKHLGSFSPSRGNKIGLICRYSEDWPFHRAQELLLTVLSVLQGEQQLCPPAHPHCWKGSPGLSTSYCPRTGSPLHLQPPLPFLPFQGKALGVWLCAFTGFFHTAPNLLQEVDLLPYHPKVCSHHPPVAVPASGSPSPVLQYLHLYLVPDWVLIDLVWYS